MYRLDAAGQPPLSWSRPARALVGVAFDPDGELVVASNDTVYRFVDTDAAPSTAH